ncbi:hypothetical protein PMAG_a3198 [Pseudoalteromonas mariniglutinosa NCIMB 1770]|nr:hypothetical protein [Pseudoalteromonas mariniglutinosa NCIMB 1770]
MREDNKLARLAIASQADEVSICESLKTSYCKTLVFKLF